MKSLVETQDQGTISRNIIAASSDSVEKIEGIDSAKTINTHKKVLSVASLNTNLSARLL